MQLYLWECAAQLRSALAYVIQCINWQVPFKKYVFLKDKNYRSYEDAKRLSIVSAGANVIFVADVYIPKCCFVSIVNKPVNLEMPEEHSQHGKTEM